MKCQWSVMSMKWFVRSSPKKQIQGIFLLLLTCCRSKILVFFKNLTNIWERIENHAVIKRSVVRHERYTYKVRCFWGEGVQKEKKNLFTLHLWSYWLLIDLFAFNSNSCFASVYLPSPCDTYQCSPLNNACCNSPVQQSKVASLSQHS